MISFLCFVTLVILFVWPNLQTGMLLLGIIMVGAGGYLIVRGLFQLIWVRKEKKEESEE